MTGMQSLFFSTQADRIALARQRYFEEGELPLQKNRLLRDAWLADAELGATHCGAMLTDPSGVLIGSTSSRRAHEKITPVAHRIGSGPQVAGVARGYLPQDAGCLIWIDW